MLASFTYTWNHEAALGTGSDFAPNALINTVSNQDRFTTWQAKVNASISLPLDFRIVPVVRSQSGTPFARTFVRALNYGNATIKADTVGSERTRTITLVDLRTEKGFSVGTRPRHGLLRPLQPVQRERGTDHHHEFRRFLATTHSDHGAARAQE